MPILSNSIGLHAEGAGARVAGKDSSATSGSKCHFGPGDPYNLQNTTSNSDRTLTGGGRLKYIKCLWSNMLDTSPPRHYRR
jgi:hypothetical protein